MKLPNGAYFIPDAMQEIKDKYKISSDGSGNRLLTVNRNEVQCGDFLFDLRIVPKEDIMALRKYLPYKEYVRLKNRFSAKATRRKNKLNFTQT